LERAAGHALDNADGGDRLASFTVDPERELSIAQDLYNHAASQGAFGGGCMQHTMPGLRRNPTLITFTLAAMLQGCQATSLTPQPGLDTQQTAADANRALQRLNPAGTRLDDAARNMEQAGFECQPLATAAAGYQLSMLCTVSTINTPSTTSASPPPILWTVALDSGDGQTLVMTH
jgi:hypothetical protein